MMRFYPKQLRCLAFMAATALCTFATTHHVEAAPTHATVQQSRISVKGKVLDSAGEPITGALAIVLGTSNAAYSDVDGVFHLKSVAPGAKVEVAFYGYKTVQIDAAETLNITMEADAQNIDEVVVVGYGVQKKESLTGSLAVVGADDLKAMTSPTVENMLNGKVPGLFVSPGAGPGATGAIQIRGKSSINGVNAPLWVVDGVIMGNSAGTINPADIESMTVLKDAASVAIYGSQGANGVIMVTTKNPTSGKISVSATARVGISTLNNGNMEVMDGAQLYDYYASMSNAETINFTRWNPELRNSNFSWWDLAARTGIIQEYNVSLSGGTEQLRSVFSANYYDEIGAVRGYDYNKYDVRFKTDYKPLKFISIRPMVNASMVETFNQQYSTYAMYGNFPWDSPYDENGDIVGHRSPLWVNSNTTNYLYDLQWNWSKGSTKNVVAGLDFDVNITSWLTFRSINNFKYYNGTSKSYTDPRSSGGEGVNGRIYQSMSESYRRYTSQMLSFQKSFGDHHVTALAGYEFNDDRYEGFNATGTGFVNGFEILDVTAKPEAVGGNKWESATQSMFAKATYSYQYKYMFEGVIRRDGASNFGTNAKYGNFYAASAAWNINKEKFFNARWVNELKLRASYGTSGNKPSSLYPQYDLYSVSQSYDESAGALISQIGNPDLTWEKAKTLDIGLDFSAFNDRIRFHIDYYDKFTTDLLFAVPVSGVVGVTSIWRNVGEMRNQGVEVALGGDMIRTKNWVWGADLSIGTNQNRVQKLYDGMEEIIYGGGSGAAGGAQRLLKPGMDSDTWYVREWAGVCVDTGAPTWYKTTKDGAREVTYNYADADQVAMGAYTPLFFGGFSTNLSYKNWDLSAQFGFSVGGTIYNYTRSELDSDGAYTDRNQMVLQDSWNRWEKPGDIATHPVAMYNNDSNSNKSSSRFLEDGSYLKLRTLSLGYTLNLPDYMVSSIRFGFNAENLFCITNYSGVDPEVPPLSGGIGGEVAPGSYPMVQKFLFSVNFTF